VSFSNTTTATFNRSNARRVATKMAGDLRRLQQQYGGWPSDQKIDQLIEEVTELLALDYMDTLEIGYERDGKRVLSLKYKSRRDGTLVDDDNAGRVPRGIDITGCQKINYLTHNEKWRALTTAEQEAVEARLPIKRAGAPAPVDGAGYWTQDRTYSSNGGGTERSVFKPYTS
jgi:hypothetical protein